MLSHSCVSATHNKEKKKKENQLWGRKIQIKIKTSNSVLEL